MGLYRALAFLLLSLWSSVSFAEQLFEVYDCGAKAQSSKCAEFCKRTGITWSFDIDAKSNKVLLTSTTEKGFRTSPLAGCTVVSKTSFACEEKIISLGSVFFSNFSMSGNYAVQRSQFLVLNPETNKFERKDSPNMCAVLIGTSKN